MNTLCRLGAAWLIVAVVATAAHAAGANLEPFMGEFTGESVLTTEDDWVTKRDINVAIGPYKDNGFMVNWITATYKPDGRVKRKEYTINFQPSRREGLYEAAMRANLFGGFEPLDPMKGDPYAWATVIGRTMTVYVMLIDEAGAYEMQVYERTLTDEGMDLKFSRVHEGQVLADVQAKLVRK